jgi:hypothetical protein
MLNGRARTTRSARRKACLALLAGLVVLGGTYAAAERKEREPEPAAPSITAKPPKHSRETWASFSFRDRWRRATYRCSLDGSRYEACHSPKRYPGPLAKGRHTFRVRSSTRRRALAGPASYTWLVQRLLPTPHFTRHPADPTESTGATFAFSDRRSHASFRCRLDGGPWRRCASPIHYSGLRSVNHHFYVYVHANTHSEIRSHLARFDWTVIAQVRGESFSIRAGAVGPLYPGAVPFPIPLTLSNPNGVSIYVTSLTVAVTSSPAGCSSSTNISLTQSSASSTSPILIQTNSSVRLPAQGVTAPTIQLLDLPVNQDACENTAFPLTLTGSAHS